MLALDAEVIGDTSKIISLLIHLPLTCINSVSGQSFEKHPFLQEDSWAADSFPSTLLRCFNSSFLSVRSSEKPSYIQNRLKKSF